VGREEASTQAHNAGQKRVTGGNTKALAGHSGVNTRIDSRPDASFFKLLHKLERGAVGRKGKKLKQLGAKPCCRRRNGLKEEKRKRPQNAAL